MKFRAFHEWLEDHGDKEIWYIDLTAYPKEKDLAFHVGKDGTVTIDGG